MRGLRGVRGLAAVTLAALLVACGGSDGPGGSPPSSSPPPATCGAGTPVPGTPSLTSQLLAGGFQSPLDLQAAPGDRERLYVVEQGGRIQVVRSGQVAGAPFLDIGSRISRGGERGLLGLAFHPQFATNRRFFVNYTDRQGDTQIAEFRAASGDQADPQSERPLLFVAQPFANHNGGGLAFGNDGMLYLGLGDGGSGGDPFGNGQSLGTRLGKMLRIDVDRGTPYAVPSDNPFATRPGAMPEIWAFGLRNPFRFSFDRATGDLYIGDVGQNRFEEVDVGVASRKGGENYGWNTMEGNSCYAPPSGCSMAGLTLPVLDYGHGDGCSITGGYVYRGCRLPGYAGTYFYGDYCAGFVRSFRLENGRAVDQRDWTSSIGRGLIHNVTSFGVDLDGEVYVVDYGGAVYRIVPAS
ncbi:MAG: glucose dehydrogenase [Acidobacteria bacterium]|nr:MAG: glucose dehydrogenase [Acidobacteriota bacterium]